MIHHEYDNDQQDHDHVVVKGAATKHLSCCVVFVCVCDDVMMMMWRVKGRITLLGEGARRKIRGLLHKCNYESVV